VTEVEISLREVTAEIVHAQPAGCPCARLELCPRRGRPARLLRPLRLRRSRPGRGGRARHPARSL